MEVFAKSNSTTDQAGAAVHDAIDRVSGAARPAVDRIASGAHTAVDKVADAASKVSDTLCAKSEQLKEVQAKVVGSVRSYVAENPLATVGIAVAAGFLVSRLLRSRYYVGWVERSDTHHPAVIPAKAGIHFYATKQHRALTWIPAFAGMTV